MTIRMTTWTIFRIWCLQHRRAADQQRIARILDHFDAHPLLASRYRCVFPRNFANPDDDTWPYFFGTVDLPFERVTMEEEDPYV